MENKISNFKMENKWFQISCYFKGNTSGTSNSHFYRRYKPFEHNTKKLSPER